MISIKKTLEQIDRYEKALAGTLGSYVQALDAVEENLVPVTEDLLAEFRRRLRTLRREILSGTGPENLAAGSKTLAAELAEYRDRAGDAIRQRDRDVKEILAVLAQAVSALNRNSEEYGGRFRGFARRLEDAARLPDLREIRRRIEAEVAGLKASVESMCRESANSAVELETELLSYRRRLQAAETLAATDPLTGAANRREGEQQLEKHIRNQAQFSIVLFDLDRFKTINDQYGHVAGDEVLRAFAARLSSRIRPGDMVCRWGGDEFLVILECGLRDALGRARQLSELSRTPIVVRIDGRECGLSIEASVGVAEHLPGETADRLFARADTLLYREKGERRAG